MKIKSIAVQSATQAAIAALNWYDEQDEEIRLLADQEDSNGLLKLAEKYIVLDLEEYGPGAKHEKYAAKVREAFKNLASIFDGAKNANHR